MISQLWRRYLKDTQVLEKTQPAQDRISVLQGRRNAAITAREIYRNFQDTHEVAISDQTVRNRLHEADPSSTKQSPFLDLRPINVWMNQNGSTFYSPMSFGSGFTRIVKE
ncbi:hypothetical protein HHI36_018721 [Cryptolaemus montrouzieri]|uniref:Transposase Tc1-like domain-containing protein n=1 Tax=Cryptolaemus montrouzieri TaxID=559131 RepID=A0ABD2P0Z0_9CUCU